MMPKRGDLNGCSFVPITKGSTNATTIGESFGQEALMVSTIDFSTVNEMCLYSFFDVKNKMTTGLETGSTSKLWDDNHLGWMNCGSIIHFSQVNLVGVFTFLIAN